MLALPCEGRKTIPNRFSAQGQEKKKKAAATSSNFEILDTPLVTPPIHMRAVAWSEMRKG